MCVCTVLVYLFILLFRGIAQFFLQSIVSWIIYVKVVYETIWRNDVETRVSIYFFILWYFAAFGFWRFLSIHWLMDSLYQNSFRKYLTRWRRKLIHLICNSSLAATTSPQNGEIIFYVPSENRISLKTIFLDPIFYGRMYSRILWHLQYLFLAIFCQLSYFIFCKSGICCSSKIDTKINN